MKNKRLIHRLYAVCARWPAVGLAVLLSLGFGSVQAQNGTIRVTGNVAGGSCSITTPQVPLGNHPLNSFTGPGNPPAGMDWVDVPLTSQGCDADIVTVHMGFEGNADAADSRLFAVAPNGATGLGIELQVKDSGTTVIPNGPLVDWAPLATGGVYAMRARYVQTPGPLTPGAANSTVTVLLSYN